MGKEGISPETEKSIENKETNETTDGSLSDPRVKAYLEVDPAEVEVYLINRYLARQGNRDAQEVEKGIWDKICDEWEKEK